MGGAYIFRPDQESANYSQYFNLWTEMKVYDGVFTKAIHLKGTHIETWIR